jgi:hypothetical protein
MVTRSCKLSRQHSWHLENPPSHRGVTNGKAESRLPLYPTNESPGPIRAEGHNPSPHLPETPKRLLLAPSVSPHIPATPHLPCHPPHHPRFSFTLPFSYLLSSLFSFQNHKFQNSSIQPTFSHHRMVSFLPTLLLWFFFHPASFSSAFFLSLLWFKLPFAFFHPASFSLSFGSNFHLLSSIPPLSLSPLVQTSICFLPSRLFLSAFFHPASFSLSFGSNFHLLSSIPPLSLSPLVQTSICFLLIPPLSLSPHLFFGSNIFSLLLLLLTFSFISTFNISLTLNSSITISITV